MAVAKTETNLFDEQQPKQKSAVSQTVQAYLALPGAPDPEARQNPYPYNGSPVFLFDKKGAKHEAVWRVTRSFHGASWAYRSFWAKRNSGGQEIDFEPIGYAKHEEPPLLGVKK